MRSLFAELARQAAASARREVEAYAREIPEFASLDTDARARAETLEYAVWLRRRTLELAPHNAPLTPDDLAAIAAMGEVRGGSGMSLESRQRVLRLHTALMLRDIHEAVDAQRGGAAQELLRVMGWFAPQGERGIGAYCQGFVTALRHRLPYVEQVALLARSLLTHDPLAAELAPAVGMELPRCCAVTVIRVADGTGGHGGPQREVEHLVKAHRVPMVWCPAGDGGGELIALVPATEETPKPPGATGGASPLTPAPGRTPAAAPASGRTRPALALGRTPPAPASGRRRPATTPGRRPPVPASDPPPDHPPPAPPPAHEPGPPPDPAPDLTPGPSPRPASDPAPDLTSAPVPDLTFEAVPDLARDLVRDFAGAVGRACAAGIATAPLAELAGALTRARRISRAAPLRRAPARPRPHTTADVFVELAVADVPLVDAWLATVAGRLEPGPDLVVTLDAYYRHDMDRSATAAALNVHPRTLDYRLRRVRELTGLPPGSTRGVRILSAAVTRRLAMR
ncbi:PucR family transcriptional regulator [Streptomyces longispororuber]|nr:helix-turn-helix domain-containing protein [Streptomyces longispororuber]